MNPVELYTDLAETMNAHNGLGLAAPQIGIPLRVCVIRSDPIVGLFNPDIIEFSAEYAELEEGCLSFPGIYAKVKRSRIIKVWAADPTGSYQTMQLFDISAKVVQHEVDHLNGKLFTRNVQPMSLAMACRKAQKTHKKTYLISDLKQDELV
jgi:peptide deformylase